MKGFAAMAYVRNEQSDLSSSVKPTKDCSGYSGLTVAV